MPGMVFCLPDRACCEKVGSRGKIIEVKKGRTGVNFDFWSFWMRFCRVESCLLRFLYNVSKMSPASIGGGFHFLNQRGIQSLTDWQAALLREKIRKANLFHGIICKANFPPLATLNDGASLLLNKSISEWSFTPFFILNQSQYWINI